MARNTTGLHIFCRWGLLAIPCQFAISSGQSSAMRAPTVRRRRGFYGLSTRRPIASTSLSSLRLIWPSCAAEYSAARAPWRLDVSGGTTKPIKSSGSKGTNSSETVFATKPGLPLRLSYRPPNTHPMISEDPMLSRMPPSLARTDSRLARKSKTPEGRCAIRVTRRRSSPNDRD